MSSILRSFNNTLHQNNSSSSPSSPSSASSNNQNHSLNTKLQINTTTNTTNNNNNNNNNNTTTTLINEHTIYSTSLSMPSNHSKSSSMAPSYNHSDDPELKKKLKILKKEYLKQKAELERLAQIALCQQEELKQKDYQIKKYKQQCEEQLVKLSEYESQLQIERELCEGAIRMKKSQQQQQQQGMSNNDQKEKSNQSTLSDNDLSLLLLDEGLTTRDVMEKTYKYLQDDTYTFMLNTDEYMEEETISSLKHEIATLREENFVLREEKHKLNIEKVHLYELVHDLNQNYLRSQQPNNNNN